MRSYLVIEKDQVIINLITQVMGDFTSFRYIGNFTQYPNTLNTVLKEIPDLVFFNIDTIFENPFQFVDELTLFSENKPILIALSATKDKSYQAIKYGFFDYLITPVSELELRKSILRFQKNNTVKKTTNSICIRSYNDFQYLETDAILFLKADNNTTDFYMNDGTKLCAFKTLKTFETLLPSNFLRIHKSYIINKDYVTRIQFSKSTCTIRKNHHTIPFTKTYLDNVELMKNTLTPYSCLTVS
ncbi:MAG: response regulator transcription factor [Bacteroidetes bacterium]|nr:response regulator transcription factor [Bacteroidota bacterium]